MLKIKTLAIIIGIIIPLIFLNVVNEPISNILIILNGKPSEDHSKVFANFKILIVTRLIPDEINWGDLVLSDNTIVGNITIKFPIKPYSGQYWTYGNIYYLHLENNKIYNFKLWINNEKLVDFEFNASLYPYTTPYYYFETTTTDNIITTITHTLGTWTTWEIRDRTIFATTYTIPTTTTETTTIFTTTETTKPPEVIRPETLLLLLVVAVLIIVSIFYFLSKKITEKKFFKTLKSIFHCFLGILSGIFTSIPILIFPVISFLIFLTFIVYETLEEEEEQETTKNFVEFFIGVWIGILLHNIFNFFM
jgi:hypothetical protein